MEIVDTTKFVIGLVFLVIAAGLLVRSRGEKGFGQTRQAAALSLLAAAVFLAIGLGFLDL